MKGLLRVWLVACVLLVRGVTVQAATAPGALDGAPIAGGPENYALSNSVTIALGEEELRHGLTHVTNQKDGLTQKEGFNGLPARVLKLEGNRTTLNFYFKIDPGFKENDLSSVRIDVEYLAPEPGMMGVHYDALDDAKIPIPKYQEALTPITLTGSTRWMKASFRTRGDAGFNNRENGQSDFRIWAKTPILYVRRVTVRRSEASPDEKWMTQFAKTNQVSVLLGQEDPDEEGLRFIEQPGPALVQTLDGVPCRYLNRLREGRMFGSLYFAISPSFKGDGLKNARVEVEYLGKMNTAFRLQYDAMDGERHRLYMPLLAEGMPTMRFGTGADYGTIPTSGVWSVATFHITNGVFMNMERNGADFRIEVVPPEIYVRRVTVAREDGKR
jgi:hypothetical protein